MDLNQIQLYCIHPMRDDFGFSTYEAIPPEYTDPRARYNHLRNIYIYIYIISKYKLFKTLRTYVILYFIGINN